MRLRTKLTLVVSASIAAGIVGTALVIAALANYYRDGYSFTDLDGISVELQQAVTASAPASEDALRDVLAEQAARYPGLEIEWLRPDGTMVYASTGRTAAYDVAEMTSRFVHQATNIFAGEPVSVPYEVTGPGGDGFLVLTLHAEHTRLFQVTFTVDGPVAAVLFLGPILLVLLIPAIAAIVFSSRMIRRLRRLNEAVKRISVHEPVLAIADAAPDEIGQLAGVLQNMSQRIAAQVQELQESEARRLRLVSDLSHDLRTPLTAIRGYAETLAAEPTASAKVQNWSNVIVRRARYMDDLLTQLFELARRQSGPPPLARTRTNVSELLRRIVLDYVAVLDDHGIEVDARLPADDVWLDVDAQQIERACRNLIDNAIKYGGSGRYLGVHVDVQADAVEVAVIDRGEGIPTAEIPRLLEPYYRVSRGRGGDGVGLGLPIAAAIAAAHGGRVAVESEPGVMTRVSLVLPR